MILQSLNDYYHRLAADPTLNIPRLGFSRQKISFALVISMEGKLLQVVDIRDSNGKKSVPRQLVVPEAVIKSVNIAANFLWDNAGYVLGADAKENPERVKRKFSAFKDLHNEIGGNLDDEGMSAVLRFLESWNPSEAYSLSYWEEIAAGANLVFQLDGALEFVHERHAVKDAWLRHYIEKASNFIASCLVTGEKKPVARLHPKIKGVRGSQSTGASIVSFNLDAFDSYGKKQNFNAPVGEDVAFRYTTALNHLLNIGSRQKIQIGDATTVFWTERDSPVEGFLGMIFDPHEYAGDIKEVRDFLEAVREGKRPSDIGDEEMKFYILGLAPNASRLSIRFWHISTVRDISEKIGWHFRDLSIVKSHDNDPDYPGMWQLLRETAAQHDSKNISPLLAGAVMRSILTGSAYPQSLLTVIITRIRSDQTINYLRAAMIKAYLCRQFHRNSIPKEVSMSLDKASKNIAYNLGRLFAVLEKSQKDAIPGANTTIKDRYYGAASATPRTVFPQLLRLAQHHIQKAEYGRRNDGLIEDIIQNIQEFPAHLGLDDQGLFAIGYYHQRQAFFAKTEQQQGG
ncbi:MAG: CRISPR-associated protein (Cas_Csd1) [Syntrophus sp. PtaB.Bin001]|nr:MAG: CRISPR-associated protein (Cas_Csd1) [Syntrophus sp. PtaB.Bin001]